jgi:membrane-bound lytic murein transglycosylase A
VLVVVLAAAVAAATGCAPRLIPAPDGPPVEPAAALTTVWSWWAPAPVDDGDLESFRLAIGRSLEWLATQPADRPLRYGPRTVTVAEQQAGLRRLLELCRDDPAPALLAARVGREFELLRAVGGDDGRMLVTGYYEPVIAADGVPGPEYATPILGVPDDLVEAALEPFNPRFAGERVRGRIEDRRLVPYWTRAEITAGRLAGRGLELAWGRDPVDVFVMEVQGSGTLRFPDGRERRVGYAASNGRPYRSIGRLLIDEGHLPREAVTLPALRAWLAAYPAERARVLAHNESVVFFRWLDGPPLGSLGVPVTPGRSVALDARLFPPGAPGFLRTEQPVRGPDGRIAWQPLARFVVNQDTGGAIRGPGRVDFFWGRGEAAELAAGLMRQPGTLYLLVPRARDR